MPRSSKRNSAGAPATGIPSVFTDNQPLPALFVFDLDYTLWPFWVDTHVSGPCKPNSAKTAMQDRYGGSYGFYSGVPTIIAAAKQKGITMGLASRTHAPDLAKDFLRGLAIAPAAAESDTTTEEKQAQQKDSAKEPALSFFEKPYIQIFPGSKTTHFQRIQAASRKAGHEVAYEDMVFFDDESRNRNVESELGVTFVLVRDGVNCAEIDRGVKEWRKRKGYTAPAKQTDMEEDMVED